MKPEEIASITDKDGGLINQGDAEWLVQWMRKDQNDGNRKLTDMSSRRAMLAGVVAATEREECLSRFVALGGLPILDDWLQEAYKGKVGDGGSPKEGDKGVEELPLTLLKALDKLPVDLDALKTCSVGKSVNHLRSHKNREIQKKARKLVDIWKKRVDAEMKLSGQEAKSGSNIWPSYKQNSPDMMHSHLMKTGGPTEVAVKSSGAFAGSAKIMSNGMSPGEVVGNGAPASGGGKMSCMLASSTPSIVKREENDKDGGLINQGHVERLVQWMRKDKNDGNRKSTDMSSRRAMLAGVVAATEREECLSRFVALGGLPIIDDWLQEAHKGKVGDGGSPKEGDKGVEELLLTLLKALHKLPRDLDALKTCSVGNSVNHLRSHKNLEIQKKARKLVDIWRKLVDAEMKLS